MSDEKIGNKEESVEEKIEEEKTKKIVKDEKEVKEEKSEIEKEARVRIIELGKKIDIYPVATEKAINLISRANTIVFVIDPKLTKKDVKEAIEKEYGVKVESVNVHYPFAKKKRAFVKLAKEYSAMDVASKLKIL